MRPLLQFSDEVRSAMNSSRPLVALESTVIAHGLPYPTNLDTACRMEAIVRARGATPATIAVLGGRLQVGLDGAQLRFLATAQGVRKTSRRDLPIVVAQGLDGATTVAATASIAAWAGIDVFATGGIGGVHRGSTGDVSNDLPTIASVPVTVVCSGAKSILDLRATLEWLETAGVPVIGYGCDEFPAFYSRQSGLRVDGRVDTPEEAAAVVRSSRLLGLPGGVVMVVPVPGEAELSSERIEAMIESALAASQNQKIEGSEATPFLLNWIAEQSGGDSLRANVALLERNAAVAADIAVALRSLDGPGVAKPMPGPSIAGPGESPAEGE